MNKILAIIFAVNAGFSLNSYASNLCEDPNQQQDFNVHEQCIENLNSLSSYENFSSSAEKLTQRLNCLNQKVDIKILEPVEIEIIGKITKFYQEYTPIIDKNMKMLNDIMVIEKTVRKEKGIQPSTEPLSDEQLGEENAARLQKLKQKVEKRKDDAEVLKLELLKYFKAMKKYLNAFDVQE